MEKFVANIALIVAGISVTLGNFWFTYGIWPRSWKSFVTFGLLSAALLAINVSMRMDWKK